MEDLIGQEDRVFPKALMLILLVSAGLLLWNLGSPHLWQDEAQTALIARTVLDGGVPLGTDGRNSFSQGRGAEYGDDHVWRWHNWLPFYLVALSFGLLGEGTAAARLPFVLLGLATVAATYALARELWRDRWTALASSAVLALSVPFMLLARQCRYYSPAACFTVLALVGYVRLLRGKRHAGLLFLTSSILLFHSNYVYCGLVLATVALHSFAWHRDRLLAVLAWSGGVALAGVPWLVWLAGAGHAEFYASGLWDPAKAAKFARTYLDLLARHAFPPLLLLIPPALYLARRLRGRAGEPKQPGRWSPAGLLASFVLINVIVLSFLTLWPWFRYLAPVLPFLSIAAGRIAVSACALHWAVAPVVLVLVVARGPLPEYWHELTHDFEGPLEGLSRYLGERAAPDDVVAITYGDLPLAFYTGLRVIGGMTGEDPRPATHAEWIVLRANVLSRMDTEFREYLVRNVDWPRYRKITLPQTDTVFENREEPDQHLYRSAAGPPQLTLFERLDRARP